MSIILAIESSCDETACAIVSNESDLLSNVVSSQIDVHAKFGGVIPEVASRIHVENITLVIQEALTKANLTIEDIDAIAVTYGPGLIGSLHVGVQAAKTIAWAYQKPLIPVHHIKGHIFANKLVKPLIFPLISLVISGGHTELVYMENETSFQILGTTQDDAIGEAYDKVARVLGLPYPGGPQIDRLAKQGKMNYPLPTPKTENPLDFSFSGLKSAVLQLIQREKRNANELIDADVAYAFQETALKMLIDKSNLAIRQYQPKQFVLAGGVAANSRLRELMSENHQQYPNIDLILPPLSCCTDNAAMIAISGAVSYKYYHFADLSLTATSSIDLE
ncbi:MAG: tRNA (adenosine(37)-N6)-threonylcarbamoyltransferase complex transferase subunit TsaD [Erysipelotrichaceae bacterium]